MNGVVEEEFAAVVRGALDAIAPTFPSDLNRAIQFIASTRGVEIPLDALAPLTTHLGTCGPNDPILDRLALALHAWDHREGKWAGELAPHSVERRAFILRELGFRDDQAGIVNGRIPRVSQEDLPIVIALSHSPWYGDAVRTRGTFYWNHYVRQLLPPHGRWSPLDAELLGLSVDDVIARLSDPYRSELYGVKGLVMGYVQSGKTSHFSGLIAKAADSGYRLILVLAGTLDILRKQTQRRIDKEIIGRELLTEEEYGNDAEWSSFVSHGGRPRDLGAFDWERLTNSDDDYKTLKRRLSTLEFRGADLHKPFNDPANLRFAPARLAILKKTPSRISQLCDDLEKVKGLRSKLENVPTLIIDDESDQASINTVNQERPGKRGVRTSTNREIGRLLSLLPRAQYVGYTATPFANFFVDPDDAADLFPKDFIVSLRRPNGYMGAADFHDFGRKFARGDFNGNRNAFVRGVEGENEEPQNLPKAIDAFVLAGAIKLYRMKHGDGGYSFRHHTMLIHHSSAQVVHAHDKEVVEGIFREGARYQEIGGLRALEKLFSEDFSQVSVVRAPGAPFPQTFAVLKPFITQCIKKLCADKAVRVVNGAGKHQDDTPDFDAGPIWSMLVGGTKLSRGYTVEGLTVSYYRRPTGAGDTLMQMGRWFGFRGGYQDLVRLFIGTCEKRGKKVIDLYEAFESVCRDEEALRGDLKKYAAEGLQPWQVPPLVRQHLEDLPPTSRNKMFNAEISSWDHAGDWTEKTSAPAGLEARQANLEKLSSLLERASVGSPTTFAFVDSEGKNRKFSARVGRANGRDLLKFLSGYEWAEGRKPITLELDYIRREQAKGLLTDWTLLLPQSGDRVSKPVTIAGIGKASVITRSRVSPARFGVYSDPGHVQAAKVIAGASTVALPNSDLLTARRPGNPVIVLYFVRERGGDPEEAVSVGFGIQYPGIKRPQPIVWTARRNDRNGDVVVSDVTSPARKPGAKAKPSRSSPKRKKDHMPMPTSKRTSPRK